MGSVIVQIDHDAAVPVHTQISDSYASAIRSGQFRNGSSLPSIRALAARLGVSPATVVAAYRDLCDQGFATAAPRSGFRVAGVIAKKESGIRLFPLHRIEPDLRMHPQAEFASLIAVMAASDPGIGGYEEYRGSSALRGVLAELDREIGIVSDPANGMLITSGSQQAISLVARSLAAGSSVAVEDPCYPGARMAFTAAGARVVPVPMTDDGPDPAALKTIAVPGAVSVFYCCPTYGNPSGRSWSIAARQRVLESSAAGGFMILEDDFLGDLDYLDERLPRLASLAPRYPGARVTRIRTFSKCLLPALRLAEVSGESAIIEKLLALKITDDLGCSAFLQRTLARFIAQGDYRRHLERVRPRYRAQREALRAAIGSLGEGLSFEDPPAGLCLLGRLSSDVDAARFVSECERAGVLVSPGRDFWHNGSDGADRIRIGFGSLSPEEIPQAVAAMGRALASSKIYAPRFSMI